jgi:lipoprotein-anchoring transpeptidase ErfK/SrfK
VALLLALSALATPVAHAGSGPAPRATQSAAKATAPTLSFPLRIRLTDAVNARWAGVYRPALVRTAPRDSAPAVTRLETRTTDETQNIVLVTHAQVARDGQTWYRVRLPILPNNSTGWVRAGALGDLYRVNTHLYVSRSDLTATLKKNGKVVFETHIGVGTSTNPTPRGQYYVRSKLVGYDAPVYGPLAFGTSARSPTLTDWPGGGFVGIHGTNQPQILPGYVSHGCIRMPNEAILRLARLMPVGTPITIR